MGAITDMIQHLGGIVTRKVDSALYNWMLAISIIADNISGATQGNVRYVNTLGNDATGDGSFDNPFLTIQAAINSITDANPTTKPYAVMVAPGVYSTVFVLKNGVYVVGAGSGSGQQAGNPLVGLTIVAPSAVNAIDASFAGAGVATAGIMNCAFLSPIVVDFAARGSTGAGSFFLDNIVTESAISFTGGNVLNEARLKDVYINATQNLTLTNMGGSNISNYSNDFGGNLTITQSAAIQSFHTILGVLASSYVFTWTSALLSNFMFVNVDGMSSGFTPGQVNITGIGAIIVANAARDIAMPDAAARLSFGNNAAGTLAGLTTGTNIVRGTPSAHRVLTIDRPNSVVAAGIPTFITTIIVRNSSTAFAIDLSLQGGTIAPGSATYCAPSSDVVITYDPILDLWMVSSVVQSGVTTLVNGISPAIPADITANSRIVVTWKTSNGAAGVPIVTAANRTNGTRAGGGQFIVNSVALATGVVVGTDQGSYDWHVYNNGG